MTTKTKKTITISTMIGALVLAVGVALLPQRFSEAKAVAYDDNAYKITFTLDDLSLQYTHLATLLNSEDLNTSDFGNSAIVYNGGDFDFDEYIYNDSLYFEGGAYDILFSLDTTSNYGMWIIYYNENLSTFNGPMVLSVGNSSVYSLIKLAIQQDTSTPSEPPKTLWNYIRDWFVHYIWGGTDSDMIAYDSNYVGCFASNTTFNYSENLTSFSVFIPLEIVDGSYDAIYSHISLGDYLSTTSTIVVLCLLVLAIILGLIWLFKFVSGLLLLR